MEPTGQLMVEHRLIERILQLIRKETEMAGEKRQIDTMFLDAAVDFIRWYADKTHHAKEEAILFRDAAKKDLFPEDRALLQELIEDHDFGRSTVRRLVDAKEEYLQDPGKSLKPIMDLYERLVDFYREHIHKEDHIFFPASMKYFNKEEQETMIKEFTESDRKMIHAKYRAVVDDYEKRK